MGIGKQKKNRNNAIGLTQFLIAVAIFMRVIIPQGFMIGDNDQSNISNSVKIVLCTAQGELPATIDESGNIKFEDTSSNHNEGKQNSANSHCTFVSALSDITLAVANLGFVSANWDFAFTQSRFIVPQIGLGLAAPPPPKTGPPTLV